MNRPLASVPGTWVAIWSPTPALGGRGAPPCDALRRRRSSVPLNQHPLTASDATAPVPTGVPLLIGMGEFALGPPTSTAKPNSNRTLCPDVGGIRPGSHRKNYGTWDEFRGPRH